MIDAVLVFAIINVVFELVLLSMVPPKWRLRLLGSRTGGVLVHLMIMVLVLIVHWGTLVGTMSGFLSFILSIATFTIAKQVFGYIEGGVFHRRVLGYKLEELQ